LQPDLAKLTVSVPPLFSQDTKHKNDKKRLFKNNQSSLPDCIDSDQDAQNGPNEVWQPESAKLISFKQEFQTNAALEAQASKQSKSLFETRLQQQKK
jgi:hypothetical protein